MLFLNNSNSSGCRGWPSRLLLDKFVLSSLRRVAASKDLQLLDLEVQRAMACNNLPSRRCGRWMIGMEGWFISRPPPAIHSPNRPSEQAQQICVEDPSIKRKLRQGPYLVCRVRIAIPRRLLGSFVKCSEQVVPEGATAEVQILMFFVNERGDWTSHRPTHPYPQGSWLCAKRSLMVPTKK